jgi:hypothetical protein
MRLLAPFAIAVVLGLSSSAAWAAQPTAEEINRVFDYFKNGGAEGPIVLELTLCKTIGKNDEGRVACDEKLGATMAKGDELTAFMRFFVPKGMIYEDVEVKFLLDGAVRIVKPLKLESSFSYGSYTKYKGNKAGTWEVQIVRGAQVLATAKITAQ